MDQSPLFQQIAESVRQEILYGALAPGDMLPSVRAMAARWQCTPGTVQRAYRELVRQGLVISRPGQGTRVAAEISGPGAASSTGALRQAGLVHRAEAFLLEALAAGYQADEVDRALRAALDRWRALEQAPEPPLTAALRFAGSHDPAVSLIAGRFPQIASGYRLDLRFLGSLGGLMALAQGEADLAGVHLWDAGSDQYNGPFVQRLLPGRRVALVTVAHRRLGLIVPAGNPQGLSGLADMARPGQRFVNRQRGSGTRVWLDEQLGRQGIDVGGIAGYDDEETTHSAVAEAVAEGRADVGLGVEAAALAYELGFVRLAQERYDLAVPADLMSGLAMQALVAWLAGAAAREAIAGLGGYDIAETGAVHWVPD